MVEVKAVNTEHGEQVYALVDKTPHNELLHEVLLVEYLHELERRIAELEGKEDA